MTKISYRLKDENGQYFDADGHVWCDRTYTSFETIEEAKQVRLESGQGNLGEKITIVKVTTRPAATSTGHDWNWALKQLNKGKQVARTGWTNPRLWLAKGKWGQIFVLDDTPNELGFTSNIPDCKATDWVLFKP